MWRPSDLDGWSVLLSIYKSIDPLFRGLGFPDSDLTLKYLAGVVKDGVIPRRYPHETHFSPYNAGLLVSVIAPLGPHCSEIVKAITRRMDEKLRTHFPTPAGKDINLFAEMPVIGTSRVLRAYVALSRTEDAYFRNALEWVLTQQNKNGGFGLISGDPSRMFATAAVTELLTALGGYQDRLREVGTFVRTTYDEASGSWGMHADETPDPNRHLHSPVALAIQTWQLLKSGSVLSDQRIQEFEPHIARLVRTLAERLSDCAREESGTLQLLNVKPIPLFHFTLVEALHALLSSGLEPWQEHVLHGLVTLKSMQFEDGGFKYGVSGDKVIWASVEALKLLLRVEARMASSLDRFATCFGEMLDRPMPSGVALVRSPDEFRLQAKEFCESELVPSLKIKMRTYASDKFFLEGTIGLFSKKCVVVVEPGSVGDTEINRWLASAEKNKTSKMVVLISALLTIGQRSRIWEHNRHSKYEIDVRSL